MDYQDIKKLIDYMGNSKLESLEIEFPEGIKIKMSKTEEKVFATKNGQFQSVIEGSSTDDSTNSST